MSDMAEQTVDHRRAVAERNIDSILDATEDLLSRNATLSMSAVAAEAGVSRPTLYAHFADREALLSAVVARAVHRWVDATERIEPDQGPALEALTRLVEVGWQEISRSSHVARAASAELSPETVRTAHESGVDLVRRLVRRGRRDGSFRTDVPAEWLVSALFGLIHTARDDVTAGRLTPGAALKALSRTVPDLFRAART